MDRGLMGNSDSLILSYSKNVIVFDSLYDSFGLVLSTVDLYWGIEILFIKNPHLFYTI